MRISVLVLLTLAIAGCAKAKSKSSSAATTATSTAQATTIAGTVSLDTALSGATIFVFKADAGGTSTELAPTTTTDANGQFSLSIPAGDLDISTDTPILMSKATDANGNEQILWSFVAQPGTTNNSNLNELTSFVYDIGVQEKDFDHLADDATRVAKIFGTTTSLTALDPSTPLLTRLGQVVATVAKTDKLAVGEINNAITEDLRDGALDGEAAGTPVTIGSDGTYAKMLTALQTVIAGNAPDLNPLESN